MRRTVGFLLLVVSAALGVQAYGWGVGLVTLCAWVCLASWMVALLLARRRSIEPRQRV